MSSPASRRFQRAAQASTPRRSASNAQNTTSSPANGPNPGQQLLSEASQSSQQQGNATPGPQTTQNVAHSSSPMFFRSSPANGSRSQANATPRQSGLAPGESSPIQYAPSSSSGRRPSGNVGGHPSSDSSNLFLRSPAPGAAGIRARDRRGDISADRPGSLSRRQLYVDENGQPIRDVPSSNAATFSNLDPTTSEANALGGIGTRYVWGSNISQTEVKHNIKEFLLNYESRYRMIKDGTLSESEDLPENHPGRTKEYVEMMQSMLSLGVTGLNLDLKNLKAYPATIKLWHQIHDFPDELIDLFDNTIKDCMIEFAERRMQEMRRERTRRSTQPSRLRDSSSLPPAPSSEAAMDVDQQPAESQDASDISDLVREVESKIFRVRPFNVDETTNLRDLNPKHIDTVVSVKGLVIRTTPVIPDMKDAFFQCNVCGTTTIAEIYRGRIAEPSMCTREACKAKDQMQLIHNRSGFADKQVIKLQETPDNVPDGQTPHSVSICAFNEMVDFCKAGDRVEITGIFKCNQVRVNPRQRTVKNVYKTYVDTMHIQKTDKRRVGIDTSTLEQEISEQVASSTEEARKITEEEEENIKATAARSDVYELLARSLAPSIYELDDVKKGILLQLFGGTNKSFEKGGNPKYRGDINVLLCGDPSTAKSQLLQYVHKIAPRGVYTSGKGSSAVGLTAYVTRDVETRQMVLESGALVLSDGGVCCIDEFDKMSESTRSVLHEVMEQQTVSIAKAGIITTLNARTSILASANPIGSKYNPNLPVPQNIDLPPTLLSRFDLVYLVLDQVDEANDRRLARHLIGMYLEDNPENAASREVLPIEFLTSYISYARDRCHPKITQAASDQLVQAYVEMRKLGEDVRAAERRITATTRQLESMIRLAEAHAKMRLAEEVTADDVMEAVRLIKSAIKQAATDSRTGLIDMGLLTEGTSASERRRKQDLKKAIIGVLDELTRGGGTVRYTELSAQLAEQSSVSVDTDEMSEAVRSLQQEGHLQMVGDGARRSVRRTTGVS